MPLASLTRLDIRVQSYLPLIVPANAEESIRQQTLDQCFLHQQLFPSVGYFPLTVGLPASIGCGKSRVNCKKRHLCNKYTEDDV